MATAAANILDGASFGSANRALSDAAAGTAEFGSPPVPSNDNKVGAISTPTQEAIQPQSAITTDTGTKLLTSIANILHRIDSTLEQQLEYSERESIERREDELERPHAFALATKKEEKDDKKESNGISGLITSLLGGVATAVAGVGAEVAAVVAPVVGTVAAIGATVYGGKKLYDNREKIGSFFGKASDSALSLAKKKGKQLTTGVRDAILEASKITDVSEGYMLSTAGQESSFNPNAKAPTSSATGLYQFLDATWAAMVKKYGRQYGIGMGDRRDARKNAIMGGLFARDNASILKNRGYKVGDTELYLSHFLGAGKANTGASGFLQKLYTMPNAIAATNGFSKQAAANRGVFYDRNGRARTFREVYEFLGQKVGNNSAAYAQLYGSGTEKPVAGAPARPAKPDTTNISKYVVKPTPGAKPNMLLMATKPKPQPAKPTVTNNNRTTVVSKRDAEKAKLFVPQPGYGPTSVSYGLYMRPPQTG